MMERTCAFDVRPSTLMNAGNGLFTLAPLSAGAFCCTFDGVDFRRDDTSADAEAARDGQYNLEHPREPSFRAGLVPPRSPCGVAQMANDAGMTPEILATLAWSRSVPSTLAAVREYESRAHATSSIRQNVSSDDWEFLAASNVSAGAEVFLSYSFAYWTKFAME